MPIIGFLFLSLLISTTSFAQTSKETLHRLVQASVEQCKYTNSYDPSYVKLEYPGGDVPLERGVCADVIVRAFRKVGVDLQKEVHEDMKANFSSYPKLWRAKATDTNIDHRRVANLMTFFDRKGKSLALSSQESDYLPGDVVAWRLDNGLLHIGIVSDVKADKSRYKIVHNISEGAKLEDILFSWKIIGHYRYF